MLKGQRTEVVAKPLVRLWEEIRLGLLSHDERPEDRVGNQAIGETVGRSEAKSLFLC